jgi:peroxiredoxin Q/BCP
MHWNVLLILFLAWGIPLTYYRGKFRKLVYQTQDWTINIKPVFIKELRGLFGNLYPEMPEYIKLRNFYRIYLAIYLTLFFLWKSFS